MRAQLLLLTFFSVFLIFLAKFEAKIVPESESKAAYIKNLESEDTLDDGSYIDETTEENLDDSTEEVSENAETTTNPSTEVEEETNIPPQRLNVTKKHETFDVVEGERLTMPCNVRLTSTATVVWRKGGADGSQLISNSYSAVRSELYELNHDQNAALVIKHVNRTDEGLYACTVSDNGGKVESVVTTHHVNVKQSLVSTGGAGKMYACLPFLIFLMAISLQ